MVVGARAGIDALPVHLPAVRAGLLDGGVVMSGWLVLAIVWSGFGLFFIAGAISSVALQVKRLVDLYDPQPTEDEER